MNLKDINQPVAQTQGVLSQIFVRIVSSVLAGLLLYMIIELIG